MIKLSSIVAVHVLIIKVGSGMKTTTKERDVSCMRLGMVWLRVWELFRASPVIILHL